MERPILTIEERADTKTRHGIAGAADSDDGIVAASSADEALRSRGLAHAMRAWRSCLRAAARRETEEAAGHVLCMTARCAHALQRWRERSATLAVTLSDGAGGVRPLP